MGHGTVEAVGRKRWEGRIQVEEDELSRRDRGEDGRLSNLGERLHFLDLGLAPEKGEKKRSNGFRSERSEEERGIAERRTHSGVLSLATVSLKNSLLVAYRESSGTPSLYFPVSIWNRRGG